VALVRSIACVSLCAVVQPLLSIALTAAPAAAGAPSRFGELPLLFVENRGQLDQRVRFVVPGSEKTVYFASDGITIALQDGEGRYAVKIDFVGANPKTTLRGEEREQAVFSYFRGKPEEWATGCATYSSVVYEDLWPGIDLVYRGEPGCLKYEFLVDPGADPRRIRLAVRGASSLERGDRGELVARTPAGSLVDGAPVAFQLERDARSEVPAAYDIEDGGIFGFDLGAYDRSRPLVIDPDLVVYSGFLGGAGDDLGHAIAADATGATYVTGETASGDFPVEVGPDPTFHGSCDAFVAKIWPSGATLAYAGYLGGTGNDRGWGIAIDGEGAAYVVGNTTSSGFPVAGGLGPTFKGGEADAFLTKVSPNGVSLVYSGFLGGSSDETAYAISVDDSGAAYVTGSTRSWDFPVVVGPGLTYSSNHDVFVLKVDPAGESLVYSGLLGGMLEEYGYAITVDGSGAAYVAGTTRSPTFPTVVGPDLTSNGALDAFVLKVAPSGASLQFSGFLGGSFADVGRGIALDDEGAIFVAGETSSSDFPRLLGPDPSFSPPKDAFITKIAPSGESLLYSGFIGGSSKDWANAVGVDGAGSAYVTGGTLSGDFPCVLGPDSSYNGGASDIFVTKVSADGRTRLYSGYFGGEGLDEAMGIAVGVAGDVYLTGVTNSQQFPIMTGPETAPSGVYDAFVVRFESTYGYDCRRGTVNLGNSLTPYDVLKINGSAGGEARTVTIAIGESLEITMAMPLGGPNPAPFAMYGWAGEPNYETVTPHPMGLGTMCFPTPVTGGVPGPRRIWNNIGHPEILGYPHLPSTPAPSVVLYKVWGVPFVITATFQGFIFDNNSAAQKRVSITNAVILRVNP